MQCQEELQTALQSNETKVTPALTLAPTLGLTRRPTVTTTVTVPITLFLARNPRAGEDPNQAVTCSGDSCF